MMAERVEKSDMAAGEAPFPPSWIDRLIRWIDRLPGPAWPFYALGILAAALLINVILWVEGSVPFGSYGSIDFVYPPLIFYLLALYHYLTRISSRSLESFRQLLEVDDADIAEIEYKLTTLPRWLGWLAIPLGIVQAALITSGDPAALEYFASLAPLPLVAAIVAIMITVAFFIGLIIRSIRQLRSVSKLHSRATNINLLKLGPAHAFSTLSASTGVGLILFLLLGYAIAAADSGVEFGTTSDIAGYVVTALFAVVIFVVPLRGMRDLLQREKARKIDETTDLLQMTSDTLDRKIKNRDYSDLQGMDTAIKALVRKREMFKKIPTWPWNPGTIRGFASTLLLPIFLWLVTRLLGRFF